jgi:GntR family transcriptional regulator
MTQVLTPPRKPAQPRYRQIAALLRKRITSGKLKPGDSLPTEMDLCATFSISRHTARDALRLLSDDGLIERRRGAGTIVAEPGQAAFAQALGDFESILQYAREARFDVTVERDADPDSMLRLALTGPYRQFIGFRRTGRQPPQAITAVYVRRDLAPDAATISGLAGSVSEWIEQIHGLSIDRVTQRMEAVALNASQARRLGTQTGFPALRTVRRYSDSSGDPVLVSESLHPAGRFAYEMKLDRRR